MSQAWLHSFVLPSVCPHAYAYAGSVNQALATRVYFEAVIKADILIPIISKLSNGRNGWQQVNVMSFGVYFNYSLCQAEESSERQHSAQ